MKGRVLALNGDRITITTYPTSSGAAIFLWLLEEGAEFECCADLTADEAILLARHLLRAARKASR